MFGICSSRLFSVNLCIPIFSEKQNILGYSKVFIPFLEYIIWFSGTCSIKYVVGTLLGKKEFHLISSRCCFIHHGSSFCWLIKLLLLLTAFISDNPPLPSLTILHHEPPCCISSEFCLCLFPLPTIHNPRHVSVLIFCFRDVVFSSNYTSLFSTPTTNILLPTLTPASSQVYTLNSNPPSCSFSLFSGISSSNNLWFTPEL